MARPTPRRSLLDEIEAGALDESADLSSVLRRCIALGAATGSERLRDWASLELKGYSTITELPDYRRVVAPLLLDGQVGDRWVTGQTVPLTMIPDVARESVGNELVFPQPIAEIEHLLAAARKDGNRTVRLSPQGSRELVALINRELVRQDRQRFPHSSLPPPRLVERIYWSVDPAPIARILDVVRTTLVELVAEMRSATPARATPSTEAAEQAVDIAIYGKRNRVIVNQVQSDGQPIVAGGSVTGGEADSSVRRVMWWLVALATVIAAIAAVWALFLR